MKCEEAGCYEAAIISVRKDLFGKSDAMRHLCSHHAPRWLAVSGQVNEKAIGGSDVCHTCAAHVKVITEDLEPRIHALEAELAAEKMQHSVTIADEHESRTAFQDGIRAIEAELIGEMKLRQTAEAYAARNALRVIAVEAALRKAVNYYTGHFGWCAKNGQMPQEVGRSYTHPTDWDNWRATVACTCDIEKLLPQTETKSAPGFCPECLMTGGHKLRCSKAETTPKPITTFTGWIQGSCDNCGKSAREHIGISMGCPQAETPDYGCTGCRSTPCICATLETKGESGG